MAVSYGKGGLVKIGTDTVAHVQTWSVSQSAETGDTTSMGDDWTNHILGAKSWEGSMDVLSDPDDPGQQALSIGASVTVSLYENGEDASKWYFTGLATVTSSETSSDKSAVNSGSVSFTGNGPLEKIQVT